jgi:endonuclease G, mitochondrial
MRFISNIFIQWASCIVLTAFIWGSQAQTVHISHCMAACPQGTSSNSEILVRHLYVTEINNDSGLADWVAYRVLQNSIGVASLLPRWWQQDDLLSNAAQLESPIGQSSFNQPDLNDEQDREYRVNEVVFSSEDRARLAPITSFAGTPFWDELNNLSNMSPLPTDLRSGAWAHLEQTINELAADKGELYVISGPLYEVAGAINTRATDGSEPASYFKVIATPTEYAAFIFPSDLSIHADYCDQLAPINRIQEISGLVLFPDLENELTPDLYSGLLCELP